MNLISKFVVLIERRRSRSVAWILGSLALAASLLGLQPAHADAPAGQVQAKIARDLADEIGRSGQPKAQWARDLGGVRYVQAVVVSSSADPEMNELRAHVARIGGAVHAIHPAANALTVQVRASHVMGLAQRSDVASISPNRVTQRTDEMSTGKGVV